MEITTVDVLDAALQLELTELLSQCVESGASVGFVLPIAAGELETYWRETAAAVKAGTQLLLVAREGGTLAGTVQLALAQKANARHRAEVQRLLVPPARRRQGIGRRLMKALEQVALDHGRSLLVWDTIVGDAGDQLYAKMGYLRAGIVPAYALSSDGSKLEPTVHYYALLSDAELTMPAPMVMPVSVAPPPAPATTPARPAAPSRASAFTFSGAIERYGRSEPLEIRIDPPAAAEAGSFVCVVHAETLGLAGMRVLGAAPRQAAHLALDLVKQSTDGNPVLGDDDEPVDIDAWTVR
jgi:acetyltransferase